MVHVFIAYIFIEGARNMKVSRDILEKDITKEITKYLGDKKKIQKYIRDARTKYEVPEKLFSDFITLRKDVTEANTFMLFILADVLLGSKRLETYFTPTELKSLPKEKWQNETVKFPLCFDMTKINETQYIGHISVRELMLLKDAQLINYNENAQRTMKHIVKGELEYFQISLNKEAVAAIIDSYEEELYIPNTITLNIPEDADFSYDDKRKQLVIHNTEYLDILDGYHRYIAMSKIYSQNPNFDYEMELRIVQFSEEKARRFIWQEDQKTKMRKIDSDSMDIAKVSNKIVDRMNNNSKFILASKISRNKGIINAAYLSNVIDIIFLKGIKKSEELRAIKTISSELAETIEEFTDLYPEYLDKPWDKMLTYMVCYEGKFGSIKNLKKDMDKVIKDGNIYLSPSLTKADVTRTHKLLGKEGY